MFKVYVPSHDRQFDAIGNVQCDGQLYPYIVDWDSHPFTGERGKTYIVVDDGRLRLLVTEKHALRFMEADECVAAHEQLRLAGKPLPDIGIIMRYIQPR